jgi:hypothetical protein
MPWARREAPAAAIMAPLSTHRAKGGMLTSDVEVSTGQAFAQQAIGGDTARDDEPPRARLFARRAGS